MARIWHQMTQLSPFWFAQRTWPNMLVRPASCTPWSPPSLLLLLRPVSYLGDRVMCTLDFCVMCTLEVFFTLLFNVFRLHSIFINKSHQMSLFITNTCHFYDIYNFLTSFLHFLKKLTSLFTPFKMATSHFVLYPCGSLHLAAYNMK